MNQNLIKLQMDYTLNQINELHTLYKEMFDTSSLYNTYLPETLKEREMVEGRQQPHDLVSHHNSNVIVIFNPW